MTFESFQELCNQRRSVHAQNYTPIHKEDILDLLAIAHVAPSVANTQPWHFHVVCDAKMLSALIEATWYKNDLLSGGALIVVTSNEKAKAHFHEKDILWDPVQLQYSCAAAMEHIVLGATAKGLASTWVSFHNGPVHDVLSLKKEETVVGGILLGDIPHDEEASAQKRDRGELANTYTFY